MCGPGAYVPDPPEGMVDVKDLPAPPRGLYSRNHQPTPCPRWGHLASRHTADQRTLHALGEGCTGHPVDLLGTSSAPSCSSCTKSCHIALRDGAPPAVMTPIGGSTWPCVWSSQSACPPVPPAGPCGALLACWCPLPPSKTGGRLGGNKAQGPLGGAFLAWALTAFAGSAAVDARYAGPSWGLAAVDHRQDQRMGYAGLAHAPRPGDLAALLGRLQRALDARPWARKGIPTDGAARSPEPSRKVLGDVPQQLCPFPGIKDLPQGVGKAVAQARERWAQSTPTWPRGRPSAKAQEARRVARNSTCMPQNIRHLCQARSWCVKRRLTLRARQRRISLTRGLPQWRKRRERMDALDAVLDRRCRTPTALGTWKKRRPWVNRCTWMGETVKKVCAPQLAQALTFLDDTVFPAPSKAVERGNRRHRTRPKSVYRVRSKAW